MAGIINLGRLDAGSSAVPGSAPISQSRLIQPLLRRLTRLDFGAYHLRLAFRVGTPLGRRPKTFLWRLRPTEVTYGQEEAGSI
jgi:hypothetical protein